MTILEMMDDIALDLNLFARAALLEKLAEVGIPWKTRMRLDKVTEECAVVIDESGHERLYPGDTVLALGFRSDNKLANDLEGKINEVHSIGDCVTPGKIRKAIHQGFNIASQI